MVMERSEGLRIRRVRPWDRVRARMRAAALDRQLAAGASPESSTALAVHAGHLCRPAERRVLAHTLTRLTAAAASTDSIRRVGARAPVCRSAIHDSEAELAAVVGRLEASEPISVQGVARIRNLLTDGSGPLYRRATSGRLRRELHAALEAMDCFA
jgi:hypothetical protein